MNATCRRHTCATLPAHEGRTHLDPASDLYDGPDTAIDALNSQPRTAARTLRGLLAAGTDVAGTRDEWYGMPVEARVALHTMVREIHRLTEQVAAVRVDADRQIRQAMAAALNCEQHGKDIATLSEQLHAVDTTARRNDNGRLALVGGLSHMQDYLRALETTAKTGGELPAVDVLIGYLLRVVDKTFRAHMKAWKS